MMANCVVFLCFYLANLFLLQHSSSASSIITPSKPVFQGQTLVSQDQAFELGFFDPNNSGNHYVGIWYKTISPRVVVWVANGGNPVVNSSSSLQIGNKDGNLRLVDGEQEVIWSTNISAPSNSSFAELSNGGNLILRDNISDQILWQSALNPSNTAFPGTWKVSDSKSGRGIVLISWKSENDPSPGSFTVGITLQSPPQSFTWKDSKPYWRSGQWDRSKFIGIKDADETYLSYYTILDDTEQGTASLTLRTVSGCTFANLFISSTGDLKYMCYEVGKGWYSKWQLPQSRCDVYGVCGPFAICIRSEPITCRCFKGFTPKTPDQWNKRNWTEGCVRQTQLSCETKATNQTSKAVDDGFSRIRGLKLPDFSEYVEVSDAGCKQWCLMNCTCLAYAYVNGIGCLVWATQILDVANLSPQGEDLFLRLAHSELDEEKKAVKWIISIIALSCFVVFCVVAYCFLKGKAKQRLNQKASILTHHTRRSNLEGDDPMDVPLFDFGDILDATNNFNATNKLGQGGFGPVYKGILKDGKDVAVKRLSSSSEQGVDEFKNEIMLISKLQHRNLVRLIGYCVEREEKILIYEFMPHKSLDTYLFDSTKKTVLDWPKRFNIILGIARGMSYLHRDSYLRVIHRDLKASNILLDEKMNPKISDFGLARIFEGTQVLANTHRVVGTLGYMSPEYAMSGIFSEKSDVFSFGVLLLEIVSGKKINSFQYDEEYSGILAYAWHSWGESKGLGMVDEALGGSFDSSEAAKCVNIGLLCVQDYAGDRPTMPAIVFMLSGETNNIPHPKQPALSFYTTLSSHIHSHSHFASSENELTESIIQEGR